MGQKTHPRGLRLGIIDTWNSKWYSEREYAQWLHEDLKIQEFVKEQLSRAGISRVEIERIADRCSINIHTARPGIVIGRRGAEAERLQADLEKRIGRSVRINVSEVKTPELDAQLVSESVALQIERRTSYRHAMRKSMLASIKAGALGVKIVVGGRLGGAEMSRSEAVIEGRVPLHTLRADIDYGFSESNTTYGKIGVKTWIFKGEIIGKPLAFTESSSSSRTAQVPRESGRREDSSRRPSRRRGGDRRGGDRRGGGAGGGRRPRRPRQRNRNDDGNRGNNPSR